MEGGLLRDGGHLGPWIAGIKPDQTAQGAQCHLLGMGRSEVGHNAQYSASSSFSGGSFSRRPSELEPRQGPSESNGPPIVPYCLKRAREEPAGRPLSPPVSEEARSVKDVPCASAPNAPGASVQPGRVEAGIPVKSREPLLLANTGTTAFNNCKWYCRLSSHKTSHPSFPSPTWAAPLLPAMPHRIYTEESTTQIPNCTSTPRFSSQRQHSSVSPRPAILGPTTCRTSSKTKTSTGGGGNSR